MGFVIRSCSRALQIEDVTSTVSESFEATPQVIGSVSGFCFTALQTGSATNTVSVKCSEAHAQVKYFTRSFFSAPTACLTLRSSREWWHGCHFSTHSREGEQVLQSSNMWPDGKSDNVCSRTAPLQLTTSMISFSPMLPLANSTFWPTFPFSSLAWINK